MGSIFGGSTDKIARPDYSELEPVTNKLSEQMNNTYLNQLGRQTTGQAIFGQMGQQSLANTLQGQAAQRGIRPSQLASMGNSALGNQQSQLAGQAAVRDALEREQATNSLANILMNKQAQNISVDQANANIEQQNKAAQDKMIGMGLTAAGTIFGGPAGGLAASALTSGMGNSGSTSMGANPYTGTASYTGANAYDPKKYNMGQNTSFQGGF